MYIGKHLCSYNVLSLHSPHLAGMHHDGWAIASADPWVVEHYHLEPRAHMLSLSPNIYAHMYTHIYIYIYIYIYKNRYNVYIWVFIYVYIYICIRTMQYISKD